MTDTSTNDQVRPGGTEPRSVLFSVLVGLTTLAILLQGLWAGIFLEHDGKRDAASSWIDVHSAGAYLAVLLALAATIVAVVRLRSHKNLLVGAASLTGLLIVETGIGTAVHSGADALTALHVPLAMAIMGTAVWLSRSSARLSGVLA